MKNRKKRAGEQEEERGEGKKEEEEERKQPGFGGEECSLCICIFDIFNKYPSTGIEW